MVCRIRIIEKKFHSTESSLLAGEHTLLSRSFGIIYMVAIRAAMYMVPIDGTNPGPGTQDWDKGGFKMTQVIREGLVEIKEDRYIGKVRGLENFSIYKVSYDSDDHDEFVEKTLWFDFYTTANKLVTYLRFISRRLKADEKLIVSDGGQIQAVVLKDMIIYLNGLKNFLKWEEDELYRWNHSSLEERVKILEAEDQPIDCNQLPY